MRCFLSPPTQPPNRMTRDNKQIADGVGALVLDEGEMTSNSVMVAHGQEAASAVVDEAHHRTVTNLDFAKPFAYAHMMLATEVADEKKWVEQTATCCAVALALTCLERVDEKK